MRHEQQVVKKTPGSSGRTPENPAPGTPFESWRFGCYDPAQGMEIRAVLFDLDGTLVDSERESAEGMARALEHDLGLTISQAARDYVVGHSWNEIDDFLRNELGDRLTWSMEELIRRSAAHREAVIAEQGLTILPG